MINKTYFDTLLVFLSSFPDKPPTKTTSKHSWIAMEMKIQTKKKRRTPLSCIRCRQKKIKCDRTKPKCMRCINSNVQCEYDSPLLWSDTSERNLKREKNNTISFVSSLDYPSKKTEVHPNPRMNVNQGVLNFSTVKTVSDPSEFKTHNTEWPQPRIQKPYLPLSIPSSLPNDTQKADPDLAKSTLRDKLSEIAYLKKRISDIENDIAKSSNCMSMVIDDRNENLTVFRSKRDSRFMCLGTFVNTGVWKRDPLMCNFFKKFFASKGKHKHHHMKTKKKNIIQKYYSESNKNFPSFKAFEFLNMQLVTKKQEAKFMDSKLFVQEIERILPPCDVIQFHIEHFMKLIYPFIPILDEHIFRMNISRILVYPNLNEVTANSTGVKVCIDSKTDGLRISILLLIIRLSYLSVYLEIEMTDRNPSFPEQRILSYPIGPAIISLVQYALQNTNYLRKTSAETLQLLLLYRFYQVRSCEDGDGFMGSDGTVMTGLIVATSKAVGLDQHFNENIFSQGTPAQEKYNLIPVNKLHKIEENGVLDQNKFLPPDIRMNLLTRGPRVFNQLWRKLWWTSLQCDLNHSMIYGAASQFDHDPEKSRTGKPNYDPGFASVQNTEIERFTVSRLNQFSNVNYQLYQLLEMLHSFKRRPTVIEVESKIDEILTLCHTIHDNSGNGKYISPTVNASAKVNNLISKVEIYGCMLIVEYSLLLQCEQIGMKEENGPPSEDLGIAKVRFSHLFPKVFSNWITVVEDLISLWPKMFGCEIVVNVNDVQGSRKNAEFAPYIVLLASVINIVFVKLISVLFYAGIRLLITHHQIRKRIIPIELNTSNIIKIDEFVKLYKHIVIIFKALIVMEGKLSRYWYPAFRSYNVARKFVEWFEAQQKWVFNFTATHTEDNEGINGNENLKSLDAIISDSESKSTGKLSQEFFLNIDTNVIQEINFRLDNFEDIHLLKDIHSAYVNAIPKFEDKPNNINNNQNLNRMAEFHTVNTQKSMLDSLLSPTVGEELVTEQTDSEGKSTGADSETINFLESLETDDLDDISGWFNHTALLDSLEFDSFKQDFAKFI